MHTEQEDAHRIKYPASRKNDPANLAKTLHHYRQIVQRYRKQKQLLPEEKATLRYVRHEVRRLNAKLNPSLGKSVLHNKVVNWVFNSLLRRQGNYTRHNREFNSVTKAAAVQYNVQKLDQQLIEKGFNLDKEPLTRHLTHELNEFTIRHTEPKYPNMDFILQFKKFPDTDAYYFAGFDAAKRANLQEMLDNRIDHRRHSYSNSNKLDFTAQDATNIGHNRPVMKTNNGNDTWFIPDLAQPAGFRHGTLQVEKELAVWPIKEMQSAGAKDALIAGLQAGNVRDITVTLPDKTQEQWKVAVRADGEGLTFADKDGRHIDPHAKMKKNEHLEKLHEKALSKKNGQEQAPRKRSGMKLAH